MMSTVVNHHTQNNWHIVNNIVLNFKRYDGVVALHISVYLVICLSALKKYVSIYPIIEEIDASQRSLLSNLTSNN